MIHVCLRSILPLLICMAGVACSPSGEDPGDAGAGTGPAAASSAPSLDELANLAYADIFDSYPVQLENGYWEGEPFVHGGTSRPAVGLVEDFRLVADLDGDGIDEAVVLLWQTSGGSGVFYYLAVAGQDAGQVVNRGTAYIGDRVQVRATRTGNGRIELDVIQQGISDAACCPSERATRTWVYTDQGLVEIEAIVTGSLSLVDLSGPEWVLQQADGNPFDSREVTITLNYDGRGISGFAGCNRYFMRVKPGERPGELVMSRPTGTRRTCAPGLMVAEARFLDALEAVRTFSFQGSRLVLTWNREGETQTLVFEPRTPEI